MDGTARWQAERAQRGAGRWRDVARGGMAQLSQRQGEQQAFQRMGGGATQQRRVPDSELPASAELPRGRAGGVGGCTARWPPPERLREAGWRGGSIPEQAFRFSQGQRRLVERNHPVWPKHLLRQDLVCACAQCRSLSEAEPFFTDAILSTLQPRPDAFLVFTLN